MKINLSNSVTSVLMIAVLLPTEWHDHPRIVCGVCMLLCLICGSSVAFSLHDSYAESAEWLIAYWKHEAGAGPAPKV